VSGLVSVVFVYESSLKMVALHLKCTIVELSCGLFLWSVGFKMSEAGDAQQAQRFVVQGISFAPW
jgi:hypothetical protein